MTSPSPRHAAQLEKWGLRLRIETAFGSTQETKAALHIARCWRYVDDLSAKRAFDLADEVAKLCSRLTR